MRILSSDTSDTKDLHLILSPESLPVGFYAQEMVETVVANSGLQSGEHIFAQRLE